MNLNNYLTYPLKRLPTHLITGFPGAGKTALLRALLAQRSGDEHWALLLNATSRVTSGDGVTVHHLGTECACCTGRVGFRTALVRLLRSARPQRLLIELPGTGDPAGVKQVLQEDAIARAVTLVSNLCVVQPRHLANADIATHDIYRSQLNHATQFVLAEADKPAHETLAGFNKFNKPVTLLHDATLALLAAS